MAKDSGSREVLKLVHPGRIKEIHRKPIKASEVMKKYPRHSVTRPDVFKFPWMVVHPDSVLELGKVFYVVPNHTLHKLKSRIKTEKHENSPSPDKRSLVRENDYSEKARTVRFIRPGERAMTPFHDLQEEKSPCVSGTRSKIDCKYEDWVGSNYFPKCPLSPELKRKSPIRSTFDGDDSSKKSWKSVEVIKDRQELKLKRSEVEIRSPKKKASKNRSNQHKPLKDLFEMEATSSLKKVHKLKHQNTASLNTPHESPAKSDQSAGLKKKQQLGISPRKRYPVEGWDRTLNFKPHQEAAKRYEHKCRFESNNLPQHPVDSPKNKYMIEPAQPLVGGGNREQTEKESAFSPTVKSRGPAFSSEVVSTDDKPSIVPAKADGAFESSSSKKDARILKSCLKNSSSRSRGLRVKFALPGEDEEKLKSESSSV